MEKAKKKKKPNSNRTQEQLDSTFDSELVFIKGTHIYSKGLGLSRNFPSPYKYEMGLMWDIFLKDTL